jgi:hypothetical protein
VHPLCHALDRDVDVARLVVEVDVVGRVEPHELLDAVDALVARALAREPEDRGGASAGDVVVASATKRISAGALGGGSSGSSGGSWSATQLATIRISSTSSTGTTERPGARASAAAVRSTISD